MTTYIFSKDSKTFKISKLCSVFFVCVTPITHFVVDEIVLFLLGLVVFKCDHLHASLNEAVGTQGADPLPQHLTVKLEQVTQILLTHTCWIERLVVKWLVHLWIAAGKFLV